MLDAQLQHLGDVLTNKRIWALNVGENFQTTSQAWHDFTRTLQATAVAHLYVSEQHLRNTDLKVRMREAIRINRRCGSFCPHCCSSRCLSSSFRAWCTCRAGPGRDIEVTKRVRNMWWNPKVRANRRITLAAFESSMAALRRQCIKAHVSRTSFDRIQMVRTVPSCASWQLKSLHRMSIPELAVVQKHAAALRHAQQVSHECAAAQRAEAQCSEAERASRERLQSYIERLQGVIA